MAAPANRGTAARVERGLPADIDAEKGIIGSVAVLPSVLPDVSLLVSATDFYDDKNAEIFKAMVALVEAGKPVDSKLLESRVLGVLSSASFGGKADEALKYMRDVLSCVPNAAHARYYAGIVREKARLRRIIHGCTRALSDAYDELPVEDVLGGLEQSLSTEQRDAAEARPIGDVWARVIEGHRQSLKTGDVPALMSGLPSADNIGLVFVPGELTVLAARPGVGKTSLATQIAMHHAKRGRPVLYCSLEMDSEALGSRVLYAAAGLNNQSIRTRGMQATDIDSLAVAKETEGDLPLYVWSPPRVKVGVVRAMAAAVKAKHGLKLIIVDYTAWIVPDDPRANRRDQIGEIVKGLRDMGKRLGVPVLLLHQLNREGAGEKPQLTHLRESGCVEEDADIVAFIHPLDAQPPQSLLIVAKSRQGAKGERPLRWYPESTMFGEMDDAPIEDHASYDQRFTEWNNR